MVAYVLLVRERVAIPVAAASSINGATSHSFFTVLYIRERDSLNAKELEKNEN